METDDLPLHLDRLPELLDLARRLPRLGPSGWRLLLGDDGVLEELARRLPSELRAAGLGRCAVADLEFAGEEVIGEILARA